MKLALIIVTALCFTRAAGQGYLPFPQDSAQWCIQFSTQLQEGGDSYEEILAFRTASDTTLDGVHYKNIGVTKTFSGICCEPFTTILRDQDVEDTYLDLFGALRTDSGKVYFYKYADGFDLYMLQCPANQEVLLLDFTISEGDSVLLNRTDTAEYVHYYDEYMMPLADGYSHRVIQVIHYDNMIEDWIDGVGSGNGAFFGSYMPSWMEGSSWGMKAFLYQDMIIYNSNSYDSNPCSYGGINAITENKPFPFVINATATNTLTVKTPSDISGTYHFQLYNLLGEAVLSERLSGETSFNISQFAEGFYLATIRNDSKVVYEKMIVKGN